MATFREEDHLLDQVRSENGGVRKSIEEISKVGGILFAANATLLVFLSGILISRWQNGTIYTSPTLANVTTSYLSSIDLFQLQVTDLVGLIAILFFAFSAFFCIELFVVSMRNPSRTPVPNWHIEGIDGADYAAITHAILARERTFSDRNLGIYQDVLKYLFRALVLCFIGLGWIIVQFLVVLCGAYCAILYVIGILPMVYVTRFLWRRPKAIRASWRSRIKSAVKEKGRPSATSSLDHLVD